jgi:hypothetical protein
MGRRGLVWLVTLPVVLAGVEGAHALANAAFGSPEGPGEAFASRESGAQLRPLLVALALGLVVLALLARAAGRWWVPRHSRLVALPFACLPPLVFVLLELVEGLSHGGAVPWHEAVEPTFLAGLALQLPFALLGYLVARSLLRLSDELGRIVRRRPPLAATLTAVLGRPRDDVLYPLRHGSPCWGRAPPAA